MAKPIGVVFYKELFKGFSTGTIQITHESVSI